MKKIGLVLGLGIFLMSFAARAFYFEGEIEMDLCPHMELTVDDTDYVIVDFSEVVSEGGSDLCVELVIPQVPNGATVLSIQMPISFQEMNDSVASGEQEDDVRFLRTCLDAVDAGPVKIRFLFAEQAFVDLPWESPTFVFGALSLTEKCR